MFSYEFCKIFKTTYCTEHLRSTASCLHHDERGKRKWCFRVFITYVWVLCQLYNSLITLLLYFNFLSIILNWVLHVMFYRHTGKVGPRTRDWGLGTYTCPPGNRYPICGNRDPIPLRGMRDPYLGTFTLIQFSLNLQFSSVA